VTAQELNIQNPLERTDLLRTVTYEESRGGEDKELTKFFEQLEQLKRDPNKLRDLSKEDFTELCKFWVARRFTKDTRFARNRDGVTASFTEISGKFMPELGVSTPEEVFNKLGISLKF
jgi:hypothetical protein